MARLASALFLACLAGCTPDIDVGAAARAWGRSTLLFPAPAVLAVKAPMDAALLQSSLTSRGYVMGKEATRAGEAACSKTACTVVPFKGFPGMQDTVNHVVTIQLEAEHIQSMTGPNQLPVTRLVLPGAPVSEARGGPHEARIPYRFKDFPKHLVNALVAIEDRRFFSHGGVDWRGVLRAAFTNAASGRHKQGASTITQQLARNYFLTPEKTFSRKLKEVRYAWALEDKLSKEQILEAYLNEVYLGQRGSVAISGVGMAALAYFSKTPKELSLEEAALLAGMIQAPNALAPDRHEDKALNRRNVVLAAMASLGFISDDEKARTAALPITLRLGQLPDKRVAPFFVDAASERLEDLLDDDDVHARGYIVETSLDPRIGLIAERALADGLKALKQKTRSNLQGAVVVLQPSTGRVLAVQGSRSYAESQFNRALDAQRQVGSVAKPLVVLTAMHAKGTVLGPTSEILDEALSVPAGGRTWKPQNNDHKFHGKVTLREVLEQSINIPAVKLVMEVGPPNVAQGLGLLGLKDGVEPVPAMALGAFVSSPLKMALAYGALADRGRVHIPSFIDRVLTAEGRVLYQHQDQPQQPYSAGEAYLITDMLEGVLERGTARSMRKTYPFPAAGKTGTTSNNKDAWFIGYDADFVTAVWVGADDNSSTGLTGGSGALPIWARVMKEVRAGIPPPPRALPDAVARQLVCVDSFENPAESCPTKVDEAFWRGREPTRICHTHASGLEKVKDNVTQLPRQFERWVNDLVD